MKTMSESADRAVSPPCIGSARGGVKAPGSTRDVRRATSKPTAGCRECLHADDSRIHGLRAVSCARRVCDTDLVTNIQECRRVRQRAPRGVHVLGWIAYPVLGVLAAVARSEEHTSELQSREN